MIRYVQFLIKTTCLLCFVATLGFVVTPAYCAGTAHILILPLAIHSEHDLAFLNRGIESMLVARFSVPGAIAAVSENATVEDRADAVTAGSRAGVRYVVWGSLTIFGNSVSTDIQLIDVSTGKTAFGFNRFGQKPGDALRHVDEFASLAKAQVFGIGAKPTPPPAPAASAPPPAPLNTTTPTPPPTASGPAPAATIPTPAPSTPPASANLPTIPAPALKKVTVEKAVSQEGAWTSEPFKGAVQGLAVADVNGDGRPDLVFLLDKTLIVEQFVKHRLQRIAAYTGERQLRSISVDAADINGNGRAEIFVNRVDPDGRVQSMVLEWDGSRLRPIGTPTDRFFRIILDADGKPILIGQNAKGVRSTGPLPFEEGPEQLFMPGIDRLVWNGKDYIAQKTLSIPRTLTVFGFAQGPVLGGESNAIVALDGSGHLNVFDASGVQHWKSDATYGGSDVFLDFKSNDALGKGRYYLPQRIWVTDIDGDGKPDVITVKNIDRGHQLFARARSFKSGQVIVLDPAKIGLAETWKSGDLPGYVPDLAVADMDGDGHPELVYPVVSVSDLGIGTATSYFAIQKVK